MYAGLAGGLKNESNVTRVEAAPARFEVVASGDRLSYQWFFNTEPLPAETNAVLMLSAVRQVHLGQYYVEVSHPNVPPLRSQVVSLEIGAAAEPVSFDKFEDQIVAIEAENAATNRVNPGLQLKALAASPPASDWLGASILRTKDLSNQDATAQRGEPHHAGVVGGASHWIAIRPQSDGMLTVHTMGSAADTTLGIYVGSTVGALREIASNNDGGPDQKTSAVSVAVQRGVTYLAAVDTIGGAPGTIRLNWSLEAVASTALKIELLGTAEPQLRLIGFVSENTRLESSVDLLGWTILQTNAPGMLSLDLPLGGQSGQRFFKISAP